jgi:hypothetical protein
MMMQSKSIEWHTSVSDTVVLAKVTRVTESPSAQEGCRFLQHAELQPLKSFRGRRSRALAIPQYYDDKDRSSSFSVALLAPGDEILAFCAHHPVKRKRVLHFWINLTAPDGPLSSHGANTNDSVWLSDSGAILAAVTDRIAREKTTGRGKRGIITWFMPGMAREIGWDLMRTAEPQFKPEVIRALHDGDTESALGNLISYPGRETEELIRPFLQDPRTMEWHTTVHPRHPPLRMLHRKRKIYPYRQLAWIALKLLGKRVAQPAGCDFTYWPFPLHGGFEDEGAFPYGNWKRIDFHGGWRWKKLIIY